ncbi:signal peptidase II [Thermovibrio sp.]
MRAFLFLVAFLAFALDRISKLWAYELLSRRTIPVVDDALSLRLAENKGAAFSLFSNSSPFLRELFLIVVPLLVVLFIVYWGLFKVKDKFTSLSLGLILGGALGNLYDRLLYGKVIDFIDFHYKNFHYPTFNLADVFVFLGVSLLILKSFKES